MLSPMTPAIANTKRNLSAALGICVLLILSNMINGCGFHLRGASNLSTSLSELALSTDAEQDLTVLRLRQQLKRAGVSVADGFSTTLHLSNIQTKKHTVAYDSRGKTARFELIKSIDIRVTGQSERTLLPKTTISTRQSYSYVDTDTLGKDEEQSLLEQEMSTSLALSIIRRLALMDQTKSTNQ